jgi:hypothetical protein
MDDTRYMYNDKRHNEASDTSQEHNTVGHHTKTKIN